MRLAVTAALIVGLAAPASAMQCPEGSSPDALAPFNWAYTSANYVMVAVQNSFDKEVRMVDADVYFIDGLGRMVGDNPLPVDPDLAIFAAKANSFQVAAPPGYDRLQKASPDDFSMTMCTRSILFRDGTKLSFE